MQDFREFLNEVCSGAAVHLPTELRLCVTQI